MNTKTLFHFGQFLTILDFQSTLKERYEIKLFDDRAGRQTTRFKLQNNISLYPQKTHQSNKGWKVAD